MDSSLNGGGIFQFQEIFKISRSRLRFTWYDFVSYNKLKTGLQDNRKLVVGLIYKKQFMSQACGKLVVCDKVVPCKSA